MPKTRLRGRYWRWPQRKTNLFVKQQSRRKLTAVKGVTLVPQKMHFSNGFRDLADVDLE